MPVGSKAKQFLFPYQFLLAFRSETTWQYTHVGRWFVPVTKTGKKIWCEMIPRNKLNRWSEVVKAVCTRLWKQLLRSKNIKWKTRQCKVHGFIKGRDRRDETSLASRLEHFFRNITSDIVSQAPFSLAADRMTKFFLALHPQKKNKKNKRKTHLLHTP